MDNYFDGRIAPCEQNHNLRNPILIIGAGKVVIKRDAMFEPLYEVPHAVSYQI